MGTITPYETAKRRRYRVRYRKPDGAETQKRGFTTMREAKLYLSMVTVSKSKGDYIDPVASRVPVRGQGVRCAETREAGLRYTHHRTH